LNKPAFRDDKHKTIISFNYKKGGLFIYYYFEVVVLDLVEEEEFKESCFSQSKTLVLCWDDLHH